MCEEDAVVVQEIKTSATFSSYDVYCIVMPETFSDYSCFVIVVKSTIKC